MHKDTRRLDLKPLGLALKRARIAKNMTQEAVGQMVDRTARTIMHIENKGLANYLSGGTFTPYRNFVAPFALL